MEWGDVDGAMKEAQHVFEESFICPNVYHHPMEPASCALVNFTDEMLDFWVPTNSPHRVADTAAHLFELNREKVRVRVPFVGGNFGGKDQSEEAMVASALSRQIGRPIKYVVTDEESFRASAKDNMVYKARIGVKADGTILGLDVDALVDTGGYYTGATIILNNIMTSSWVASGCLTLGFVRAPSSQTKCPAARFVTRGKIRPPLPWTVPWTMLLIDWGWIRWNSA